ncbi:hypothetical protein [Falsiroseomonas sp.]|uniref:hypothetical protein n=1 Tax=Falsiroseomonas sp. TaxID=2870721 RepID=UPI003568A187
MRPGLKLVPLLLLLGCAQPGPEESARVALQDALAAHQASVAGIGAAQGVGIGAAQGAGIGAGSAAGIGARPVVAAVEGSQAPAAATLAAAGPAEAAPTMAGQLVGHTPEALLRRLGTPRLRREEGPAEIWHYQASQCHLDLVLYRDEAAGRALRVAYAAARAAGASGRGEAACLRDIAHGATAPAGGSTGGQVRAGL